MARRVRIITKPRKPTFAERLEERARALTEQRTEKNDDRTLSSMLRRDIALTVNQIDDFRKLHERLRRNLHRIECYIQTEITQREPREPVYEDRRIAERDMLRARLLNVEQERRRLAVSEEERLQAMHGRLLALMNKRSYVEER